MSNQVCNKYYLFNHDCCYAQVLLIHLCYKRMSSNVQRYQKHFTFVGTKSSAHVSINCKRMCKTFFGTPKIFHSKTIIKNMQSYVSFKIPLLVIGH